ncbi:DUF2125 domain-containing protein [Labrenzia sp. 011]|uniref:DUF2125 domain-containing protein n=1 Tax=Labrenzia sp. 011 TaxID=2171494 RepID=UPI0014035C58|nr:DUF2125 domain-containing protein [Labrenzia sp. 011]
MSVRNVTPAAKKPAKSSSRRYILLLGAILLVVVAWSGAWVYGRSVLSAQLDKQMTRMAEGGLEISCAGLAVAGYPFRYEVGCTQMRSRDRRGTDAELDGLNAVALVYNPWHVIFEASAPARVAVPATGLSGNIAWETARASVKFSREALDEVNAVVRKPRAAFENAFSAGTASAEKAEVHLRATPADSAALDGYFSVDALKLESLPELQETLDMKARIQVSGGTALLAGADLVSLVRINGGDLPVRLELFEAALGRSRVGASGDLIVNGDGTLTGDLELTVGNAKELLQSLEPLFPPKNQSFALMQSVVDSLAPMAGNVDGVASITLPVKIDRGVASVGFLPLGRIPALFPGGM